MKLRFYQLLKTASELDGTTIRVRGDSDYYETGYNDDIIDKEDDVW